MVINENSPADYISRSKILSVGQKIIIIFFIALGLSFLGLLSFEQYKILKVLTALILLVPLTYLSVHYPESVIWICLMLYLTPGAEMIGNVLLVCFSLIMLFFNLVIKKVKIQWDIVLLLWSIITINAVATIRNWIHWGKALRGTTHFLVLPIIMYLGIAKGFIDNKGCQRLWRTYIPIAISYAIVQLLFVFLGGLKLFNRYVMSTHTGINLGWGYSNTLAALMALFAAVIISHPGFYKGNALKRLWFYCITFFAVATSIIIISKGAILSFLLGIIAFVVFLSILEGRAKVLKWLLYISLFIVLALIIFHSYFEVLIQRYQNLRIDFATYGRLHLIFDSLTMMRRNMFIGTGPNQHLYSDFFNYLEDPHNIFLRYGVDFGIISLFAIMIILAFPLYLIFINYKRGNKRILAPYGYFALPYFVAIFNSQIEAAITKYHYGIIFWTCYGLMVKNLYNDEPMLGPVKNTIQ